CHIMNTTWTAASTGAAARHRGSAHLLADSAVTAMPDAGLNGDTPEHRRHTERMNAPSPTAPAGHGPGQASDRGPGQESGSAYGRVRIGDDTGGTFTDFVAVDSQTGAMASTKTPSTPSNPAEGFLTGIDKILDRIGATPADIEAI